MTWSSVVSYHTDPATCGVARFSRQLADRLGVPHVPYARPKDFGVRPLLSIKFSEQTPFWDDWHHDQLWHDAPHGVYEPRTTRVWKLYELGVPALVQPVAIGQNPVLFTFGMAHKIDLAKFHVLRQLYAGWELWVSTAAHEGAGPSKVPDLMATWGPRAFDLGHLSDAALALIWPHTTAFVAFFEHGLRANNSSVHAALNARVPVITNHGAQTPADLRACTHDYATMTRHGELLAPPVGGSPYTWDRLLQELGCDPSRSVTAASPTPPPATSWQKLGTIIKGM